jgi:hypothetical protein
MGSLIPRQSCTEFYLAFGQRAIPLDCTRRPCDSQLTYPIDLPDEGRSSSGSDATERSRRLSFKRRAGPGESMLECPSRRFRNGHSRISRFDIERVLDAVSESPNHFE